MAAMVNVMASNDLDYPKRGKLYLAQIDALIVATAAKPRLDEDDRMQCQAMLRELKGRFSVDRTRAGRESTPAGQCYHERMQLAGTRLTMATHTTPSAARWNGPLQACRADIVAYLAEVDRRRELRDR
jgi:hypothetical protein